QFAHHARASRRGTDCRGRRNDRRDAPDLATHEDHRRAFLGDCAGSRDQASPAFCRSAHRPGPEWRQRRAGYPAVAGATRTCPRSLSMVGRASKSNKASATADKVIPADDGRARCSWATGTSVDLLYRNYHDEEWGVPLHEDRRLFEFIVLEG